MRADRCRTVADELDARQAAVTERHRPVATLHREDTWSGRAATASRQRLHRVIGASLYYLGQDLARTSGALRGEAVGLDDEAAAFRRRGQAAAEAEARAAAAKAQVDAAKASATAAGAAARRAAAALARINESSSAGSRA